MRTYKSKVLLFGEYSVIHGSDALAMPLDLFSGRWNFGGIEEDRRAILNKFFIYLKGLDFEKANFQEERFKEDLDRQLVFESDIPVGYGLGSSGAVCAAIFDQYFQKDNAIDILELKDILGQMECFFHGSSSGLDPLICYLDQAVLIHQGNVNPINLPSNNSAYHFFLLDTGIARKTEPLVHSYLEKYKTDAVFREAVGERLLGLNDLAIQQYLSGDWEVLFESFGFISHFQWDFFRAMIPVECQELWKMGLANDLFRLKLCGAGGGGFLLGMGRDLDRVRDLGFLITPF